MVVHSADCDDAPASTLVYPARAAADAYPNGRPHRCFHRRTARAVIEHVEYEAHAYVPSTIRPDDATRPLCRVCRGTHGPGPGMMSTVLTSARDGGAVRTVDLGALRLRG
ncbi:hypothetical protein AB0F81_16530 [Actinoplanes sp. NPDC024001]|uniref:hypothetical protein n=1 Tax=Actinoplanes sp. NPDC024001 TaxID=3154598 RepID=UPI0033CEDFB0